MNSWVGQTVGKVHIDSLRARGGMAEVYIGTHTTLHRRVAVKVLRNNFDEHSHALERFQREAIVVGNLRHPNIVQVFDFDLVDNHPYLVMEYIKGPSLHYYLNSLHEKQKQLELPQVVRFMNAMTSALQYAHDSGVIHRDIKPGNILLTSRTREIVLGEPLPDDFEPILTDFGLVRFLDSTQQTTGSGTIAGTPAYMSPEQALGELTDGRTDVYSLGIVLYEILAGHLPFDGETTMGVLMKHVNEPPAPVPGLAPAIQYVLDRALAKNVNDRFQTPAEFGEAFRNAIENQADFSTFDLAGSKPTRESSKKTSNGSQRQKILAPALLSLLLVAAAAGLFFSNAFPAAFGATSTATHRLLPTDTVSIPSNTVAWTETPAPTILLGRTGVLQFENSSGVADKAVLIASAIVAPPPDSQYEVWLVEDNGQRTSLGILSPDANGKGELTFTEEGSNLIAKYSGVEVTIEPNPDPDIKSSGIVAYSFFYPRDSLPHLRALLASYADTPQQTALIQGLNTDIQMIDEFAKEMQKSSVNGNQDRVKLFAEAILNILVGDQSPNHRDWNADGQVDDPSDGYGLLLNGRNLGYFQAVYVEADAAIHADRSSEQIVSYGGGVKTSVQNLAQWTEQLEAAITPVLASSLPQDSGQRVLQAVTLADKMINGVDLDQDGVVEPIPGEPGILVVYEQAYHMADMPLQAVGIQNIGTGTPTFILVSSTPTSGGGGGDGGGATAGSLQNPTSKAQNTPKPPPPGQQKTKEPPPGQQKTKEPPPGQQKTDVPKPGNNGNNNGNSNNGNNSTPNVAP